MKILLQTNSGLYYKKDRLWVRECAEALVFRNSLQALKVCARHPDKELILVLKFDDARYDLRIPTRQLLTDEPPETPPEE